jgi:Ca2+-transporting ATPase
MNKTHFFCTKTVDETIDYYDTTYQGLSDQQARKRLTIYGYNILQETNTSHRRTIILNQFQDFMIVLLLVSSGLARFLGDYRTSVVLLLIVLFNIVIGYYQESKAEKILENLKKLIDRKARVIRE